MDTHDSERQVDSPRAPSSAGSTTGQRSDSGADASGRGPVEADEKRAGTGADGGTPESAEELHQPAPAVPSLQDMVGSAVEAVPELALRQAAVEKVFVCYMTYVGSDQIQVIQTSPDVAKTELSLTRGWGSKDIESACEEVIEGLAEAWTALAGEFEGAAEGGEDPGSGPLDFEMVARRFAAEQQEQDELRRRARELLMLVKTVSGQLGIPNPDSPASEKHDDGATVGDGHGRLAAGLRRLASPVVDFVTDEPDKGEAVPERDAAGDSEDAAATSPASWNTPPVLTDDHQDIRTLEHVVARRAASDADVRLVWSGLEALGLDHAAVTALLGRVAELARRQLDQSGEVMRSVTAQHRLFAARIESIQRLMGVTHAVHDYFFGSQVSSGS